MKKSLLLVTITVLFTLVLAACSGTGGGLSTPPAAPGISGTSTPGIAPGPDTTQPPGTSTPAAPGSGGTSP